MEVCTERDVHKTFTCRGKYYCFTPKHHGGGSLTDARWSLLLSRYDEFKIFDWADFYQFSDEDGNLYGVWIVGAGENRELKVLGTKQEQVAQFWFADGAPHWHGFPLWKIRPDSTKRRDDESTKRATQQYCPPKSVFDKMAKSGMLTAAQATRLKGGKPLGRIGSPKT